MFIIVLKSCISRIMLEYKIRQDVHDAVSSGNASALQKVLHGEVFESLKIKPRGQYDDTISPQLFLFAAESAVQV